MPAAVRAVASAANQLFPFHGDLSFPARWRRCAPLAVAQTLQQQSMNRQRQQNMGSATR